MSTTKQTLEDLHRWMSRVHFVHTRDEQIAAEFASKLREIIVEQENTEGLADCMLTVHKELTSAGLIKPSTPPMMIADELVHNLTPVREAMMVARSWIVKRRPSLSFSRQKTVSAYIALLMKIDTALNAIS